jgi:hypothetical protein
MIFLTLFGLVIALLLPRLCQAYGLVVGICTIVAGIPSVFASQVFAGQTTVLSLNLEKYVPFLIINVPLSKFWLGWGLLLAGNKSKQRASVGFLLGGANVFGAVMGLFYVDSSTDWTLTGFWGGILSIFLLLGLGLSTIGTILNAWSAPQNYAPNTTEEELSPLEQSIGKIK